MSRFGIMRPGRNPTVNRYAGEEQPLGSPAQTANIAGAFADPLGLIDIFGQYPAFPEEGMTVAEMAAGPRSPSLAQNIADKEYLTSIIQLAGAIPAMAPVSKAARQALRAYHGTPHRFPRGQRVRNKKTGQTYVADLDSPAHQMILESGDFELIGEPSDLGLFDMGRIGQGEGAQAYGRGLYFAEAEPVAKGYRDLLSAPSEEAETASWALGRMGGDREAAIKALETGEGLSMAGPQSLFDDAAQLLRENADLSGSGSLYTVDIDVDPDDLLDWDKPLSQQSEAVQKAVKKNLDIRPIQRPDDKKGLMVVGPDGTGKNIVGIRADTAEEAFDQLTGERIYSLLGNNEVIDSGLSYEESQELATKLLSDEGIKGVKYLDQDSRFVSTLDSGKDLTSNYVIFDEELIKIVDRKREGGPVMDPTIDIFDPEEPVNRRQRAQAQREMLSRANDPLLTPAQAANISGGFAPAAGFADVLGLYPAFPDADMTVEEMAMGPRSPSLMQNVMEGNLLDSALQLAGILPVVGGVAKGARVARGIRSLPTEKPVPRAVEEDVLPIDQIKMPIAENNDELALRQLADMTSENQPIVQSFMRNIDESFGTNSSDNIKDPRKVVQKANRPSILEKKPWHNISHVRDTYRFQTELEDFRDIPSMVKDLRRQGIDLVKVDTDKMFSPKEWGWRMIAFDLRMPNGQIVEWYTPLREMNKQKRDVGHELFENWRNKTAAELAEDQDAYYAAIKESKEGYDRAFDEALDRLGLSRPEAEAEFRNMESSLADAL